jgi:hypothetical protein
MALFFTIALEIVLLTSPPDPLSLKRRGGGKRKRGYRPS